MSQNLQNFVKFQKLQLDNLVDFEKCCRTHIFLQKSVPIQPKTSNVLPKFCQKLATTPTGPPPPSCAARNAARGVPPGMPPGMPPSAAGSRGIPATYVFSNFVKVCFELLADLWQTLRGTLSAVSTPNFANK